MAKNYQFLINRAGVEHLRYGEGKGTIPTSVRRRSKRVENEAKRLVHVRSGALKRSIHATDPERTSVGLKVRIGSPLHYAYYHHEGTKPHTVVTAGDMRFVVNGKVLHARAVKNKGTKANRYLTKALPLFLRP